MKNDQNKMKSWFGQWALLTVGSATLLACQGTSRSLAPAPTVYQEKQVQANSVKINVRSEVDVVFVIDDSGSMRAHQANLINNIQSFANGFSRNNLIDFHIGVLSVYDSRRFGEYDFEKHSRVSEGVVKETDRDGKRLFDVPGQFKQLKVAQGREDLLKEQPKNFIVKKEGYVEVLKEILNVGVPKYEARTTERAEAQGSEYEESFTPVIAALSEPLASTANKGFLRKSALLVVIFVTDANDVSQLTASQFVQMLSDIKGKGNFALYGVLNPTYGSQDCRQDPSGPPTKIESAITSTGGSIFNMCENYGTQLAKVGQMVEDRTVREIRIPLGTKIEADPNGVLIHSPLLAKTQVKYGGISLTDLGPLTAGRTTWQIEYGSTEDSIIIYNAALLPDKPGASLSVEFTPVDPARRTSRCLDCGRGPKEKTQVPRVRR